MTAAPSSPNPTTSVSEVLPQITRADVIGAARGWLGTPYKHQSWQKGIGCDCLGLVIGVYNELYGLMPRDPPPYTPYWAENTPQELMLDAAREHLIELRSVQDAQPGDVLLFQMMRNRPIKHAAILVERDPTELRTRDKWKIVHAYQGHDVLESGMVLNVGSECKFAFKFPGVED